MLTLASFSVPAMIGLRNVWHWLILPAGASGRLWPIVLKNSVAAFAAAQRQKSTSQIAPRSTIATRGMV